MNSAQLDPKTIEKKKNWWLPLGLIAVGASALVTLSMTCTARCALDLSTGAASATERRDLTRGFLAGFVLAAATLTRPEGAALAAICAAVLLARALVARKGFRAPLGLVGAYV